MTEENKTPEMNTNEESAAKEEIKNNDAEVKETTEKNEAVETPEEVPSEKESQEQTSESEATDEKKEEPSDTIEETSPSEKDTSDEKKEETEKSDEAKESTDSSDSSQSEQNAPPAKSKKQLHFEELYKKIEEAKEKGETIEVHVIQRIKGGLRVVYEDLQMFLPASHFSLKRTPSEEELQEAVGKSLDVLVHEIQEYSEGRKAVIVSRKNIVMEEFWKNINVGDKIQGKVSSVASFGVFVDMGGIEGLIHISRLKQIHVKDPKDFFSKGDDIEAIIVDIDKEKSRIALSRKELEESPWKNIAEKFPDGSTQKGIVRRLTDFGAYVELEPGVDGLLRNAELSWTKRIKKPSDMLNEGEEIEVLVINSNEEKETISLSYKRTQDNPWLAIPEKLPMESEHKGTVVQVMPQGVIVNLKTDDLDIDGFMPRSKMRDLLQGKKIPFTPGDEIEIVVADITPEDESLILAPKLDEAMIEEARKRSEQQKRRPPKRKGGGKPPKGSNAPQKASDFSILDMLSDDQKNELMNTMDDSTPKDKGKEESSEVAPKEESKTEEENKAETASSEEKNDDQTTDTEKQEEDDKSEAQPTEKATTTEDDSSDTSSENSTDKSEEEKNEDSK